MVPQVNIHSPFIDSAHNNRHCPSLLHIHLGLLRKIYLPTEVLISRAPPADPLLDFLLLRIGFFAPPFMITVLALISISQTRQRATNHGPRRRKSSRNLLTRPPKRLPRRRRRPIDSQRRRHPRNKTTVLLIARRLLHIRRSRSAIHLRTLPLLPRPLALPSTPRPLRKPTPRGAPINKPACHRRSSRRSSWLHPHRPWTRRSSTTTNTTTHTGIARRWYPSRVVFSLAVILVLAPLAPDPGSYTHGGGPDG